MLAFSSSVPELSKSQERNKANLFRLRITKAFHHDRLNDRLKSIPEWLLRAIKNSLRLDQRASHCNSMHVYTVYSHPVGHHVVLPVLMLFESVSKDSVVTLKGSKNKHTIKANHIFQVALIFFCKFHKRKWCPLLLGLESFRTFQDILHLHVPSEAPVCPFASLPLQRSPGMLSRRMSGKCFQ